MPNPACPTRRPQQPAGRAYGPEFQGRTPAAPVATFTRMMGRRTAAEDPSPVQKETYSPSSPTCSRDTPFRTVSHGSISPWRRSDDDWRPTAGHLPTGGHDSATTAGRCRPGTGAGRAGLGRRSRDARRGAYSPAGQAGDHHRGGLGGRSESAGPQRKPAARDDLPHTLPPRRSSRRRRGRHRHHAGARTGCARGLRPLRRRQHDVYGRCGGHRKGTAAGDRRLAGEWNRADRAPQASARPLPRHLVGPRPRTRP